MRLKIYQVDAFTSVPFSGNPAAVCVLPGPASERWMQLVAREMNLSETAFLHAEEGEFRLRWFTPAVEVDLCGHATLAAAHVLWEFGHLNDVADVSFRTRSGTLTGRRAATGIQLDFPSLPPREDAGVGELVRGLIDARIVWAGTNGMDVVVVLKSEQDLVEFRPQFDKISQVPNRGVILTALSERPGIDFVSRFFAPNAGVPEDPVTGSAHCALGPFWEARLGRAELLGYQASARGGVVRVTCRGDRVTLEGAAVTVMVADLLAGPDQ